MQPEWTEDFLIPFTISYSAMLTFLMDSVLIDSRFSRRVYHAAVFLFMTLSCVAMILLYRRGGLLALQSCSFFVTTMPSCVLYYFLSKHRGCRFFFAFATANIVGKAVSALSMCMSAFPGSSGPSIMLTWFILVTLAAVFVVKWAAKPFCRILNTVQMGWGAAVIVTILFYLLLYGYFFVPTTIEQRPEAVPMGIIILALLFVIYWFIYKTISFLNTICMAEKTEQSLRRLLELQKEQYGIIEERIKADQIFRHDLRHHVNMLEAMLCNKNFEEALSYIRKLKHYNFEEADGYYCENAVVNAVLSTHLCVAARRGIHVSCRTVLPRTVDVDEVELCTVLSNLLENAIEHCSGRDEAAPQLDILVMKNKEQVCIRIGNSFSGRLLQDENGSCLSLKPWGGIGLKSVRAIVEKHHGVLNITHTERVFTVDVAL